MPILYNPHRQRPTTRMTYEKQSTTAGRRSHGKSLNKRGSRARHFGLEDRLDAAPGTWHADERLRECVQPGFIAKPPVLYIMASILLNKTTDLAERVRRVSGCAARSLPGPRATCIGSSVPPNLVSLPDAVDRHICRRPHKRGRVSRTAQSPCTACTPMPESHTCRAS